MILLINFVDVQYIITVPTCARVCHNLHIISEFFDLKFIVHNYLNVYYKFYYTFSFGAILSINITIEYTKFC